MSHAGTSTAAFIAALSEWLVTIQHISCLAVDIFMSLNRRLLAHLGFGRAWALLGACLATTLGVLYHFIIEKTLLEWSRKNMQRIVYE